MKEKLVSVVTVVFNDVQNIENTIKSVTRQTYESIEFIVIDGNSSDGSLSIINNYKESIDILLSENDNGIYDAMNKGNRIANGDYIIFINSGDSFMSINSLEIIMKKLTNENNDIVSSKTRIYYDGHDLNISSILPKSTNKLLTFSHQGTLIHKNIYKNYDYDLNYAICADYEYWLRVQKANNLKFQLIDLELSKFSLGGVSNNHKNLLNRSVELLFIRSNYENLSLKSIIIFIISMSVNYLFTKNESFYFKYIYKYKNMIKEII